MRRSVGVYLHHLATSFFRFVRQEIEEHAPGGVGDAPRQVAVLNHISYFEIFYEDRIVSFYIPVRCLVEKVLPLVRDFLVGDGDEVLRFHTVLRPLLLPGEGPLAPPQEFLRLEEELRVLHGASVGIDAEGFDPHVDTDFFSRGRESPLRYAVAGEGGEPLPRRGAADGYRFYLSLDGTGEVKTEPSDSRYHEVASLEFPPRLFQGEGVVPVLPPEAREPGLLSRLHPAEERPVCFVQAFHHILEALGTHGPELGERLPQGRELHCLVVAREGPSVVLPDGDPLLQGEVVELPAGLQPGEGAGFCPAGEFCSIEEGFLHDLVVCSLM